MRKAFATSIDTNISDNFKKVCEDYNLKMNVVLETFMQQFANQEFKVEVGKSGIKLKLEDWKEKSPFSTWKQGNFKKKVIAHPSK